LLTAKRRRPNEQYGVLDVAPLPRDQ